MERIKGKKKINPTEWRKEKKRSKEFNRQYKMDSRKNIPVYLSISNKYK